MFATSTSPCMVSNKCLTPGTVTLLPTSSH
uniref:Uncharacterized protein n=1 Tax=Arundo donax TaxID=35708 RepID=A0A0A8ZIJ6_ARUDO